MGVSGLNTFPAHWDNVHVDSLATVCAWYGGWREPKRKRDVWLETILSIRVFVIAEKEERGRRNNAALSGKMCFLVTMAFLVHNLSLRRPVGNVFVSPSNWQGTKSIMTYCWTCLYSVFHVHVLSPPRPSERTNPHSNTAPTKQTKQHWLMFGRPSLQSCGTVWKERCLSSERSTHLIDFLLFSSVMSHWQEKVECHY